MHATKDKFAKQSPSGGWLLAETLVALGLIGMLLTGLSLAQIGFRKFNAYQLVRQQCLAAAQAELDSFTATGKAIAREDFKRLWPGLDVRIEQTAGRGDWSGLELIRATVSGSSRGKKIVVRLSRYVAAGQER